MMRRCIQTLTASPNKFEKFAKSLGQSQFAGNDGTNDATV